jgi:DNA-binding MarR family transcriptional regulator
VRELADREGISAPSVSAQVRRIERAGLITRTTGEDRRRVGFHVTRRAVRVIDSVKSRRTTWLASRLDMLEPEQLEAIRAAARPLASLLEDA